MSDNTDLNMHDNVHTTHCCVYHGCKYGDEDCPVVNRIQPQKYCCEDCASYMKLSNEIYKEVDIETHILVSRGYQRAFIYPKEQNLEVGQVIIMDVENKYGIEEAMMKVGEKYHWGRSSIRYFIDNYQNSQNLEKALMISGIEQLGEYQIVSVDNIKD